MSNKLKKCLIALILIILVATISIVSFAEIEFGITNDDFPELIGATTQSAWTLEHENSHKYHHDQMSYVMKDEEDVYSPMTKAEAYAKISYLETNCNCFTYVNHIKHPGCSLSDGWVNVKTRWCPNHYKLWDELFSMTSWWAGGTDTNYYSRETLITKLKEWLAILDDKISIKELMEFLNDEYYDLIEADSTGYYMLKTNSSFFCIKHGQAIGKYHQHLIKDHDSTTADLATKITTTGTTFSTYRVSSYSGLTSAESFDYMDKKNEEGTTRSVKSNVKYFCNSFQNIFSVNNGFGTYDTNVFAYAAAYAQVKSDTLSYKNEQAQLGIWGVVGSPGNGEPHVGYEHYYDMDSSIDGETVVDDLADITDSELYNVGAAVDEYENWLTENVSGSELTKHETAVTGTDYRLRNNPEVKILNDRGEVTAGKNVGKNTAEPTGTTIFTEGGTNYYRIGPFEMGDYAFAQAKSNVNIENYSGSNLTKYPKLIGGLISGKMTFKNESGTTTATVNIGTGSSDAKIEYEDALGNATHKGDSNLSGSWVITPTNYIYPYPNSIFYIVVPVNSCGTNAAELYDMTFEYRQTKADGHGWVIQSKYIETTFTRKAKNSYGTCVYHCETSTGGCYNDEISSSVRQVTGNPHIYYCSEYKNGTTYCEKGTHGSHRHCKDGGCGCSGHPCGDPECTSSHKCGYATLSYCAHGYVGGKHTGTKLSWGDSADTTCTHTTRCNTHTDNIYPKVVDDGGHEDCYTTNWEKTSQGPVTGQPFLAIHDAYVKVMKKSVTTTLRIRLTTNITIDKYIYDVEHTATGDESTDSSFTAYDDLYDSDKFTNSTVRANKEDSYKETNSLKVERGDRITYKIVLTNKSNISVKVQVKDVLPQYCVYESLDVGTFYFYDESVDGTYDNNKFFITEWLTVPAKSGGVNGTKVITVTIIATSAGEIINQNEATLVTGNAGRNVSGSDNTPTKNDDEINYIRFTEDRSGYSSGSVVNIAQVDGTTIDKVLDSSDYYIVKSYNVVIDKYITKVVHKTEPDDPTYKRYSGAKDIVNDEWIEKTSQYIDRDTYNDTISNESPSNPASNVSTQKEANPIYVEHGDIVTYDIDIQNTWGSNEKEIAKVGTYAEDNIKEYPYYSPNYVKVNITDQLPISCYNSGGDFDLQYIVYKTGYGNEGEIQDDYILDIDKIDYSISSTGKLEVKDLYVNPNAEATLRVTFEVVTKSSSLGLQDNYSQGKFANKEIKFENAVYLNPDGSDGEKGGSGYGNSLNYEIRNINNYYVYNTTNNGAPRRVWAADYFVLNDYEVIIDKYISDYNHEMLNDNVGNNFERTYSTDLSNREMQSNSDLLTRAVPVEKYETVEYTIKVYNQSEEYNEAEGFYKPATTVRASSIRDKLDYGLVLDENSVTATMHNPKSGQDDGSWIIDPVSVGNNTYDFNIPNANSMLEPGGYIEYKMTVKITRSNMYLYDLENKATINVLTNINNTSGDLVPEYDDHTRDITVRNISNRKTSSDYVKLKDLIISGKVWLDIDKDGYLNNYGLSGKYDSSNKASNGLSSNIEKEVVMENIIVRLYALDDNNKNPILVRTTKTDSSGLYTFARNENSNSSYRTGLEQRILKATKAKTPDGKDVENTLNTYDTVTNYDGDSTYINYYVEFEYDGVLYKATDIYGGRNEDGTGTGTIENYGKDNLSNSWLPASSNTDKTYKTDSNAYEFKNVREGFNEKYATVSYNKAYSYDGTINNKNEESGTTMDYSKEGHESYLRINHTRRPMTARTFIKQGSDKSVENTSLLWFYGVSTYLPETEYLKYINLGLEEREELDLSITKDIYEIKTTVNGEEMTYSYEQLIKEEDKIRDLLREKIVSKANDKFGKSYTALTQQEFDAVLSELGLAKDTVNINNESSDIIINLNGNVEDVISILSSVGEDYLKDYELKDSYGISLYDSDYKYRYEQYENKAVENYKEKYSELNTEVTYKITIDNNKLIHDELMRTNDDEYKDIEIYTQIHEIVDYYDDKFMDVFENSSTLTYEETLNIDGNKIAENDSQNAVVKDKKKTGYLENKSIAIGEAWYYKSDETKVFLELYKNSIYAQEETDVSGYNKLYIRPENADELEIQEGKDLEIYVKYVVDKGDTTDLVRALKIGDEKGIAQINSYTAYYKSDNKPVSIVDKDSNVGNFGNLVTDGNYDAYEDTMYKGGINIEVPEGVDPNATAGAGSPVAGVDVPVRTIKGIVWDDARSIAATPNNDADGGENYIQYSGNGLYHDKETLDEATNTNVKDDKGQDKKLYELLTAQKGAKQNENVEENYDNSENRLNNEKEDILVRDVKVEYIEIIEIGGKYYEERLDGAEWNAIQNTRTTAKGEYTLSGFLPGYYIVRYTYGDSDGTTFDNKDMLVFNGQDYKSTKYTGYASTKDSEDNYDTVMQTMQEKSKSDAMDDEIKRLETIAYSETMVNEKAEILKGLANGTITSEDKNNPEQLKELTDNTYMYADTVKFYIKPEKLLGLTNPDDLSVKSYNGLSGSIIYKDLFNLLFDETGVSARKFEIQNLDFGIEYRPESQITLNKEISGISLITSDGTELVKLALETNSRGEGTNQKHKIIEGQSKGLEYTQFISNNYKYINTEELLTSEEYQGFVFINVDDEILQGSTIEIEYTFTAENNSEVDRISKNLDALRFRKNAGTSSLSDKFAYVALDGTSELYDYNASGEYQNSDYLELGSKYYEFDDLAGTYVEETVLNNLKTDSKLMVYSAAGTAARDLKDTYGYKLEDTDGDGNADSIYRTKEKKYYLSNVDIANTNTDDTIGKEYTFIADGDTYDTEDIKNINNDNNEVIDGYEDDYGIYLGEYYYTNTITSNDTISSLKFDKILDYVDTDLVFKSTSGLTEKNTLWSTATDKDLLNVFVKYPNLDGATSPNSMLQNSNNISYVTYDEITGIEPLTSNLVVSVDDRIKDGDDTNVVNTDLSRYLKPYWSIRDADGKIKLGAEPNYKPQDNSDVSKGKIKLTVSKVIAAEEDTDNMQYENIAEVIQFTAQTGRRTNYATTIGNAKASLGEFEEAKSETDTSATEVITLTPPTGLDRLNRVVRDTVEVAGTGIGISAVSIAVVFIGIIVVRFTIKKIRKRPIK